MKKFILGILLLVTAGTFYAYIYNFSSVNWVLYLLIVIVIIDLLFLFISIREKLNSKPENKAETLTFAQEKERWEKNQQAQIHNPNYQQTGETYEQHLEKERNRREEYTHYPE
jgi:predicted Holliday junction resolvase-like endonuclease